MFTSHGMAETNPQSERGKKKVGGFFLCVFLFIFLGKRPQCGQCGTVARDPTSSVNRQRRPGLVEISRGRRDIVGKQFIFQTRTHRFHYPVSVCTWRRKCWERQKQLNTWVWRSAVNETKWLGSSSDENFVQFDRLLCANVVPSPKLIFN